MTAAPGALEVKALSPGEFGLIEDEWNGLLGRSAGDNVFLRWEWIHTWWTVFREGKTLFVLTARAEGRLVGVAPFYIEAPTAGGPRCLLLCSDDLYPDGLDAFAERGREDAVARAFRRHLSAHAGLWDVAVLNHLRAGSSLLGGTSFLSGGHSSAQPSERSPYIKIEGTFDDYFKARPPLAAFSLMKKQKRLFDEKKVVHRRAAEEGELPKALGDLFRLHEARAREKHITTRFISEDVKRFHAEVCRLFLARKILNLQLLYDGTAPISALYGFDYKDKVYVYQSGLDPAWGKFSVGMVLFGMAIRRAFDEGREEFDFLKGGESYKSLWANAVREEVRLTVYGGSMRGSFGFFKDRAADALRKVKRALAGHSSACSPATISLK